jgi:NADH-quinone oxidoreductase subunit E
MSQATQAKNVQLESVPSIEIDYMALDDIIENKFNNDKEKLIMILQEIQRNYNFLPRPALAYLSTKLNVPYSQIYGVATFYSTFSLEPRGRNIISICLGTACHVRGGERVRDSLEESLNISDGETTEDQRFTLETVYCLGGCSFGPMVKINEDMYGRTSSDKLDDILDQYE